MTDVYEHYRPTVDGHASGVYRVVGTPGDVTLLRITDADGRRVHSGEVHHVSPRTLAAEFEPANDPDAEFSPVSALRNALSGTYWELRMVLSFLRRLGRLR